MFSNLIREDYTLHITHMCKKTHMYVCSIDIPIFAYMCECMPVYLYLEYMYKYIIIHKYIHLKLDLQNSINKRFYMNVSISTKD